MSVYGYRNCKSAKGAMYSLLIALLGVIIVVDILILAAMHIDTVIQIFFIGLLIIIAVPLVILLYNEFMKKISILPEGIRLQSPFLDYTNYMELNKKYWCL